MHKKLYPLISLGLLSFLITIDLFAFSNGKVNTRLVDDYTTQVTFFAGFQIGSCIEFVAVSPIDTGSSGNYEISISYVRGNVAAAGTFLASISHYNPNLWREVGRVNSNGYAGAGSDGHNFAIDCNTDRFNPRFRIRAIRTLGIATDPLTVHIKIRSINQNGSWTTLNVTGSDLTVNKLLPMTNDWSLYVGNSHDPAGAEIAIKALGNGNVGVGTAIPNAKLAVNGNIRAKEIKVETANWPDYVFAEDYQLPTLQQTEKHIKEKGHLPGIPSAEEVKSDGVDLGEMNAKLLQKLEEVTLHLIKQEKELLKLKKELNSLKKDK
ncbi:hypothetical protein CPT03_16990 [Pedobacter ginsengisoli]|uniref:Uncharacterized protein n=1 Tax=Pedobacter ginsengisoli TaxID=363852 RepID=A0A2D1U8X2_9SPHI|nr:hypothetical protein [Pedobacter ginsengisoli]ATP58041.1 hypothetical protein CPT03_16990 [Pedobacter ginsengisoli]